MFFQLTCVAVGLRFHFQLAEMFWCCCGRCLLPAVPFDYSFLPWIQNGDYPKVAWCLWCHMHLRRAFAFCKWKTKQKRKTKKLQLYSPYWATISKTSLQLGKKKFYPIIWTIWRVGGFSHGPPFILPTSALELNRSHFGKLKVFQEWRYSPIWDILWLYAVLAPAPRKFRCSY